MRIPNGNPTFALGVCGCVCVCSPSLKCTSACVPEVLSLALVKGTLGGQFRQKALPMDQTLALHLHAPPCCHPHKCFSEVLWVLWPWWCLAPWHMALHLVTETFLLNKGSAVWSRRCRYWTSCRRPSSSPSGLKEARVGLEHLGIQLHPSLPLFTFPLIVTIPVSKSCQLSALCVGH